MTTSFSETDTGIHHRAHLSSRNTLSVRRSVLMTTAEPNRRMGDHDRAMNITEQEKDEQKLMNKDTLNTLTLKHSSNWNTSPS
ncbi:hypothetical protein ANCCAN_05056 [Ancylostoma caninum]|uniref:Uncharacterized protein n=1 Tax=Ancylostoma caninum TaxID=29170 RepID=A0A368GWM9_ANCCA|nr:hypothetical protein ANCCAN_05056 [Ancylostoma caninum]